MHITTAPISGSVQQNVWSVPMENNWTDNDGEDGRCNKRCGCSLESCRLVLAGIVIGALISDTMLPIVITMWIEENLLTKIQ